MPETRIRELAAKLVEQLRELDDATMMILPLEIGDTLNDLEELIENNHGW